MIVERLVVGVGYQVDRASEAIAKSSYGGIAAGITAAGIAAAGFAVTLAGQQDQLAKTARGLQISTEDYTAYAFAADHAGLANEQFVAGLGQIQSKLGEAAKGSDEAAGVFRRFGVDIRDSNGNLRTAADILPDLADGYQRFATDGDRAAGAAQLFGENARRWGPLLQGGAEDLDRMTDRARELGVVLSSEDAVASERLVDAMTDLRAVGTGLARELGGVLIPRTAEFVEGLTDWLAASDGIVKVGAHRATTLLGYALAGAATPAGKAAAGLTGIAGVLAGVKQGAGLVRLAQQASPAFAAMSGGMGAMIGPAAKVAIPLALVALVIDDIIVTAEGGDSVIRRLADSMDAGEETATTFANAGGLVAASWTTAGAVLKGVGPVLDEMTPSLDALPAPIRSIQEALIGINPPLQLMIGGFRWLKDNVPSVKGIMGGIGGAFGDAWRGVTELGAFAAGDENIALRRQQVDLNAFNLVPNLVATAGIVYAGGAQGNARDAAAARRTQLGFGREGDPTPITAPIPQVMEPGFGAYGARVTAPVNVNVTVPDGRRAADIAASTVRREVNASIAGMEAL